MGIKGFSIFLSHVGCEWEPTNLSAFAGKTMAIDGIMYLYQIKLSAREPIRLLLDFIIRLKTVNIRPVFVMDGKYVHEKGQEQAYRAQKRQNLQEIVGRLSLQLEQYKATKEVGKDLAKLVNSNTNLFVNKLSKTLNVHALAVHIAKLVREISPISKQVKDTFMDVCAAFGIPVLWAKNDGEMLCAVLNKTGKVDVVFSHDSDVFAAEASAVIKQIDGMTAKTLTLGRILRESDLTFSSFKDMCILCGTDFNRRIPGLGPITAYKLIKTYSSLEEIDKHTAHNVASINYPRIREIYSTEEHEGELVFPEPDAGKIADLLKLFNLLTMAPIVEKLWRITIR